MVISQSLTYPFQNQTNKFRPLVKSNYLRYIAKQIFLNMKMGC